MNTEVINAGCAMSLPIHWWLFMSPMTRLAKGARKYLVNGIL